MFPYTPALIEVGAGESLSVIDVGHGPVVLFSHGTPTWSYEWRHLLTHLSGQFRCIAPDHLGFGLSPRPASSDYGPGAHARRFRALQERLGIRRYALVVHDFGGPFALDAALDRPEDLDALVIFNSFAWPFGHSRRTALMATVAGSRVSRWLYRHANLSFVIARSAWGDRSTMSAATWAPYLQVFPNADDRERVLWALARSMTADTPFFERLWRRLPRLSSTPVHFVWGMRDAAFPPAALEKFTSVLPHATTLRLDRAGHWPHEEQPEVCVESVAAALASARPRASQVEGLAAVGGRSPTSP